MTCVDRYNDEKGKSVLEIEATFRALVVAGSETTATALTGILGSLLRSPKAMRESTCEIRESFSHELELGAEAVAELPYLGAVIEEGLRLCSPVALGMPRAVPEGGSTVSRYTLPASVSHETRLCDAPLTVTLCGHSCQLLDMRQIGML